MVKIMVPTIIEQYNHKEYAFDIYSHLLNNRVVFLSGEINDNLANIIISELLYLDNLSNEEISLYINSPGGSISSGLAIFDTMNYIKRFALPNSEIMIHQPLGGVEGQATEIKIVAEHIVKTKEKINKLLAKLTNQKYEKIVNDTERDYYLTSQEAKKYGIIDSVI